MTDRNAHKTLELFIEVDTNDGDYETSVSRISPETLEKITPLITAIKKNPYGYQRRDMADDVMTERYPEFSKDTHNTFEDLCPYPEYGFHTIESIYVYPYMEKTVLL